MRARGGSGVACERTLVGRGGRWQSTGGRGRAWRTKTGVGGRRWTASDARSRRAFDGVWADGLLSSAQAASRGQRMAAVYVVAGAGGRSQSIGRSVGWSVGGSVRQSGAWAREQSDVQWAACGGVRRAMCHGRQRTARHEMRWRSVAFSGRGRATASFPRRSVGGWWRAAGGGSRCEAPTRVYSRTPVMWRCAGVAGVTVGAVTRVVFLFVFQELWETNWLEL